MTETLGGIMTDDYLRAKANEAAERLILAATGYRYDYTRGRWESVWYMGPDCERCGQQGCDGECPCLCNRGECQDWSHR